MQTVFTKKLTLLICTAIVCMFSLTAFAEGDTALMSAADTDITLTKTSEGYKEEKGLFLDDMKNTDPNGKTTRYCYSADAALSYNPMIWNPGHYIVYYWNVGDATSRCRQKFKITSNDGEADITLNLRSTKGWNYLGVYDFPYGKTAKITLIRDCPYGGCLRSGAIRLVATNKPTAVAYSQPAPAKAVKHYPEGKGILVQASFKSEDYTYEEVNGSFGTLAIADCTGHAAHYTYSAKAAMRYRPKIGIEGDYHVLYYVVQNGSSSNPSVAVNVYHNGGTEKFTLNTLMHNGWIYLGKYNFAKGTTGYLETVNGEQGQMLLGGGAYFVSAEDEEFDPSIYATIENPGSKKAVGETKSGEYIVSSDTEGYSEYGIAASFTTNGFYLDCRGAYTRETGSAGIGTSGMLYNAAIAESGTYRVYYYAVEDGNSSAAQKVIVTGKNGDDEKTVDCKSQSGWVSVGEYEYDAGTTASVRTPSAEDGGTTYSGGVRLIKIK